MENLKLLGRIGKGAHGLVFKAQDLRTNETVALKQIPIANINTGLPKNTMREIAVLKSLQCPHIVKLIEVLNVDSAIIIVMEYLQRSLTDLILDLDNPLTLSQIKLYSKMLLKGVEAMHTKSLMHRDLKPANLLIDQNGVLKLADFGLSRIFNKNKDAVYTHQVGTRWYRAPELLYGAQKYTPAVDLWAVGCIIAEMIDKQPLFPGETDINQLAIVLATLGTPNEEIWPGVSLLPDFKKISFTPSIGKSWEEVFPDSDPSMVELIGGFLQYDQSKRLSASQALNHKSFFERPFPCGVSELPKPHSNNERSQSSWFLENFDEVISRVN